MNTGVVLGILALFVSFYISYKTIPIIIKVSKIKGLIDQPDGIRKLHNAVPNLGGVGIFAGFIITYSVFIGFDLPSYFPALMAAITILFFVGIKDDILIIAPLKKLIGQVFAAIIVVYVGQIYIPNLDGLFGIGNIPVWIAKPFSVMAIVLIINAYNLIDGVDGLAGILAIVASYFMGMWFFSVGYYGETILCFALAGSLVGFLLHNYEPAKVFMGDTGSMIVGLLISVAAFKLIQINPVSNGFVFNNPIAFVAAVVSIPVIDTLRVFFLRLWKGKSPFNPDRSHIHHDLLSLGLKHHQVSLILGFFNTVIIGMAIFMNELNIYASLFIIIMADLLIHPFLQLIRNMFINNILRRRRRESAMNSMINEVSIDEIIKQIHQRNKEPHFSRAKSHSKVY